MLGIFLTPIWLFNISVLGIIVVWVEEIGISLSFSADVLAYVSARDTAICVDNYHR